MSPSPSQPAPALPDITRDACDQPLPPSPMGRRTLLAGLAGLAAGFAVLPVRAQSPAPAGLAAAASFADLRRLRPGDSPQPVFVASAQTAGDGGTGLFFWDAASQAPDDGGCVIAPEGSGTGRWRRLYSGMVDVRWFGARGDGVADDADAIQRAVDHHPDTYIPAGVYRLSRPIDVTDRWGRRITGAGQTANPGSPAGFENGSLSAASTLLLDADDAPVLRVAGSGNLIERLSIIAKNRQPRSAENSYGIELNTFSRSRISEIRIFNCATGIGIPQRIPKRDAKSNWLFDTTFSNIDINNFSRCGLDLRNIDGGGTGVVLSQIYMANIAAGPQSNPTLYDTDHFILGHNWAEYVLQGIHCEWSRCRDIPIRIHNCNATIHGLHLEGLQFVDGVPAIIRLEGGHGGLAMDVMQMYACRLAGGPSAAPLSLVDVAAKESRVRMSLVRFSDTLRTEGRKITAGRVMGGKGKIELSGVLSEIDFFVPPRASSDVIVRE